MILIHYGDDHRSHSANYRFLSFFGSEKEEFKAYIKLFDKLWDKNGTKGSNGGMEEVNYIREKIGGDEIKKFLERVYNTNT